MLTKRLDSYSPGDWGGGVESSQVSTVVNMLTKRLPIHLVTGVVVYRAHK